MRKDWVTYMPSETKDCVCTEEMEIYCRETEFFPVLSYPFEDLSNTHATLSLKYI